MHQIPRTRFQIAIRTRNLVLGFLEFVLMTIPQVRRLVASWCQRPHFPFPYAREGAWPCRLVCGDNTAWPDEFRRCVLLRFWRSSENGSGKSSPRLLPARYDGP